MLNSDFFLDQFILFIFIFFDDEDAQANFQSLWLGHGTDVTHMCRRTSVNKDMEATDVSAYKFIFTLFFVQ